MSGAGVACGGSRADPALLKFSRRGADSSRPCDRNAPSAVSPERVPQVVEPTVAGSARREASCYPSWVTLGRWLWKAARAQWDLSPWRTKLL